MSLHFFVCKWDVCWLHNFTFICWERPASIIIMQYENTPRSVKSQKTHFLNQMNLNHVNLRQVNDLQRTYPGSPDKTGCRLNSACWVKNP